MWRLYVRRYFVSRMFYVALVQIGGGAQGDQAAEGC